MKIEHNLKSFEDLAEHLYRLSKDEKTGSIHYDYRGMLYKIANMAKAEEPRSGIRGAKRAMLSWWNMGKPHCRHNIMLTCAASILLTELMNFIYKEAKK